MKKFRYLVQFGLYKRIKRKAFVIANVVIAILLIAFINLPILIAGFSTPTQPESQNILVYDEVGVVDFIGKLSEEFNREYILYDFVMISVLDEDAFWENASAVYLIRISGTASEPTLAVYIKDVSVAVDVRQRIELAWTKYQIDDYEDLAIGFHQPPDYEDTTIRDLVSQLSSLIVLPMFILVIMATQFVGVDIIEEKSSKAIETIIASVPAKIHFLSKITSSILFVLIQTLLTIVYSVVGALIGSLLSGPNVSGDEANLLKFLGEMIPNWPVVLIFTLGFIIVGTLLYLVIAALFASMATTQEDYQQFQTPMMLILLSGFYIGMFAPMVGGYGFMRIMTFVPIFTPMLAPVALISGTINAWQAALALLVSLVSLVVAIYFITPVYRVAILSYDQTKFGKRVKGYFKKAFPKKNK